MSKAYEQSGANTHAGYEAVERMSSHIKRMMRKEVIDGLDGLDATFDLSQLNMTAPALVSGVDGVGTKLKLTIGYGEHDSIDIDAVAMCVNDILTTDTESLYFLDYIATNRVVSEVIEQIVKGISDAYVETDTALIDGETVEMGEMYHEGEYDIAGFAVGAVEKDDYVGGLEVKGGQVVIGLMSSSIHSNGYSLVRKLINGSDISLASNFDSRPFMSVFLGPTKLCVKPVLTLKEEASIKAMNHITGGGFCESIPRALPVGYAAGINTTSFPTSKIFDRLQRQGGIETDGMYNIFNMGIGYTVIVGEKDAPHALKILAEQDVEAYQIGHIVKDESTVIELLEV